MAPKRADSEGCSKGTHVCEAKAKTCCNGCECTRGPFTLCPLDLLMDFAKIVSLHPGFELLHVTLQALQDLVKQLLMHNPLQRLGMQKGGASDVKAHPWFAGFDWDAFAAKKLKAPHIPRVSVLAHMPWLSVSLCCLMRVFLLCVMVYTSGRLS